MVLKRASIVVFVSGILLAIIAFHIRAQEKSPEKKSDDKPVAGTKAGSKTEAAAKSSADSSTDHKNPFTENVKVTFTDKYIMVESDGIPNHPHGEFPNPTNPNTIKKQNYKFYIPLAPKPAEKPTKTPFGPIGVAINGIPFYNQYNAEGGDAVKLEVFDSCCGHPDPMGRYHYHKYPVCVKSPFKDPAGEHSPLIGYAFDGYAIYGPNGEDGKPPTDLDNCNGHTDSVHGYHYHVTAGYPYILGGYHGVVEVKNLEGGGRGRGEGGRGDGKGPPGRGPGGRGFPEEKRPPDGKGPPDFRGGPPFGPPFGPPPDGATPFSIFDALPIDSAE